MKDCVIIIPAYNAAATVVETLDSIQSLPRGLERIHSVLLADDCSTDNTAAVAKAAWKSDVPLIVSRNERNLGERSTVNRVVGELPAEIAWFFLIHADDLARPNWVEVFTRAIDSADSRVGALTASYDVLFPDGRLEPGESKDEAAKVHVAGSPQSIRDTIRSGCWFKVSSCCIRIAAFRDLGGFQPDMPQLGDWEFVLRLFERNWHIDYLPLCLSVYRQLPQSVSSVSFQTHRDVREAMRILRSFAGYLSAGETVRRHLRYNYSLSRRMVSSLTRLDPGRFASALALQFSVAGNMMRCLWRPRPSPS